MTSKICLVDINNIVSLGDINMKGYNKHVICSIILAQIISGERNDRFQNLSSLIIDLLMSLR